MNVRENNEQQQNDQIEVNCEKPPVSEKENNSNADTDEGIFIF